MNGGDAAPAPPPPAAAPPLPLRTPSLLEFAGVMGRIGLTSFGGGLSAWLMRVVVQERHWMGETEFLSGLALCQVFPGINVVNLAIWLGYRMHGGPGAVVGALAMIVPPGAVLIGMAAAFADLSRYAAVRTALDGVAAAAIGLGASMGVRAARHSGTRLLPVAVMAITFVAVGVLRLPLIPVVVVLTPVSIALAAWRGGGR